MKMKKLLAVLLAGSMVVAMTACGSSATEEAAPAEEATEEAADTTEEAAAEEVTGDYDEITLTTATSYNETDFSGSLIAHMADYLEEKSGGKVKLTCTYGGAFCQDAEVYDYVMDGSLTLSFVQPVYAMAFWPYAFGLAGYQGNEQVMEAANGLLDNEETAALIQEQGAENNLHLLGHTCAGKSIFLAKSEITSVNDASKFTIGSPINLEIYAAYGFGTVAVEPADMYDSLSRGVCDCVAYSGVNALSAKLYEVAPYIGDIGAYFTNQIIAVNNEVWESLNADTQQLLMDAAADASDYSVSICEDLEQQLFDAAVAAGGTYNQFPDGEGEAFIRTSMQSNSDLIRGFAENLGCQEGMETIITAWAQGLGYGDTF